MVRVKSCFAAGAGSVMDSCDLSGAECEILTPTKTLLVPEPDWVSQFSQP